MADQLMAASVTGSVPIKPPPAAMQEAKVFVSVCVQKLTGTSPFL